QRREKRRIFGRIKAYQPKSVLQIGEPAFGSDFGAAEPLSAPLRDGMQGRVLQELRRGPFDPGMRRLGELCAELLEQARLADAGLADDLHELPLALDRVRPSTYEQGKFVLPPDERRQDPRAAAPAGPARADN